VSALVEEECSKTLHRSDLDKLLELAAEVPQGVRLRDQPGLDQDRVGTVMRAFYSSLFSTVAPQFERLQDPDTRELARRQAAEAVALAHTTIHNLVSAPANGYDASVLAQSVEEVRVLLGCS